MKAIDDRVPAGALKPAFHEVCVLRDRLRELDDVRQRPRRLMAAP